MIEVNILKWFGQCPKLMYMLAILTIIFKYKLSLMMHLMCFHKILSSPDDNQSLHLVMILLSSSFKNGIHSIIGLDGILSKQLVLI